MSEENPTPEQPAEQPIPAPRAGPVELMDRLDAVRAKLAQGLSDWSIKYELAPVFGCSRKTIGRYLSIVRKQIRAEFDPAKLEDLRNDSLAWHREMYSNPKNPPHARQRAREMADKILGIQTPTKIEIEANVREVPLDLKTAIAAVGSLPIEEQEALAAALPVLQKLAPEEIEEEGEES